MPVEIRELNIRVNLSESDNGGGNAGGAEDAQGGQEALIATVIEKVLEILKEKEER